MVKLLFKTTAYYVIWQKFRKQIILVSLSIILIAFIGLIYEDLFKVLKVTNKESVGYLLFFKWLFISIIVLFNIYVLRKTKIDLKEHDIKKNIDERFQSYSEKEKEILKKKEELITTTDLILRKYEKLK